MPLPPAAFVHIDLDGLWTLAGAWGYAEGDQFANDPVYDLALPRLLDLLAELALPATFFLIGRDLEHPQKRRWAARIAAAGHELANHGYAHRLDLEEAPDAVLAEDYGRAQEAIAAVTGTSPLGVRSPGYTAGPRTLAVCSRLGLRYDGSIFPTAWSPVLRWMAGRLRRQVARETGGAPLPAGRWYGGGGKATPPFWEQPPGAPAPILRLPVAVSPWLRLPIHASLGILMGEQPVRRALRGLARRPDPIVYLLHGLDALGGEDLTGRLPAALARGRGFRLPLDRRMAFLRAVLTELKSAARVERTCDWLTRQPPPS